MERGRVIRLIVLVVALALAGESNAVGQALSPTAVQTYRSAFDAAHNDEWARARTLAARGGEPILTTAIEWLRLSDSESGAGLSEYIAFVKENPDWAGFRSVGRSAEGTMTESTPSAVILEWFRDREPLTTQGRLELVRARLATANVEGAAAVARDTWLNEDSSAQQEIDFLRRFSRFLKPGDHEQRLDTLIWKRRYTAAERMLPRVDASSRALADARLKLARQRRGVDQAIQRVPSTLKGHIGLVFERVRWHRRKDREEAAFTILDGAPVSPDNGRRWWTERNLLARHLLREGQPADAYRVAERHGQTSGFVFAEGEWLAGWIALRFLADPERALTHFNRLHAGVTFPVSKARASYWAGRATAAMGDDQTARHWYGDAAQHVGTYYGQLAAAHLPEADRPRYFRPPVFDSKERRRFRNRELVRAAILLYEFGENELAGDILRHLDRAADGSAENLLVGQLALELDRPDIAVRAGRRTYGKGIALHPLGYPVIPIAETGSIERPLAYAVIRQESGFIPKAVSHAGARGLMQLMPGTAKQTAKRAGMPYSRRRLLDDPNYNTALGQFHLRELLDEFSGSYVLSLAGYNAGKHRVNQWTQTYGDPRHPHIDVVDWVESIPFSETRDYVQRVLENLQVYRWLMNGTQLAAVPHDSLYVQSSSTAN